MENDYNSIKFFEYESQSINKYVILDTLKEIDLINNMYIYILSIIKNGSFININCFIFLSFETHIKKILLNYKHFPILEIVI